MTMSNINNSVLLQGGTSPVQMPKEETSKKKERSGPSFPEIAIEPFMGPGFPDFLLNEQWMATPSSSSSSSLIVDKDKRSQNIFQRIFCCRKQEN